MEYGDDGDLYQKISAFKENQKFFDEKYIWKVII